MIITIGGTSHVVHDEESWQTILIAVIRMLRVEGYVFSDEDVINNLDELLGTRVREAAYAEGAGVVDKPDYLKGCQPFFSDGHHTASSPEELGAKRAAAKVHDRSEEEVRPSSGDRARYAMGKLIETSKALKLYGDYGVGKQGDVTSTDASTEEPEDFRIR